MKTDVLGAYFIWYHHQEILWVTIVSPKSPCTTTTWDSDRLFCIVHNRHKLDVLLSVTGVVLSPRKYTLSPKQNIIYSFTFGK